MRLNILLNAINIMIVFILFMIALFFTAGCSTTGASKKHYIQILYEGEIRPQEDIAVVFTSMKYNGLTTVHLTIIEIDGIRIKEFFTEVTPGVHRYKVKCIKVSSIYTSNEKVNKIKETKTPRSYKTFNAKAGYIYYPALPRNGYNDNCSINIIEKHFSELHKSKWKKTLKSYNRRRTEGLYVH